MKPIKNIKIISILALALLAGLVSSFRTDDGHILGTIQDDQELYDTIMKMDSIYFTAYNNCNMETQAEIYAEDLEFYHDQGGLSTSKAEILESIEKNICGKVTRELVKGSMEVHPIPGFGAVAIGMHKFYNSEEPDAVSKPSKFIGVWKQEGEAWKLSRVISLH